ncbi:MAG TPA: hypothetical protein VMY42_23790 [Thermoguttaceae bacterium]|nr:hypothetical protein [Thermoguttaceae bacterium]
MPEPYDPKKLFKLATPTKRPFGGGKRVAAGESLQCESCVKSGRPCSDDCDGDGKQSSDARLASLERDMAALKGQLAIANRRRGHARSA